MGSEPSDTSDTSDSTSAPAQQASIAAAARRALRSRQPLEAHGPVEPLAETEPAAEAEQITEDESVTETDSLTQARPLAGAERPVGPEPRPIGSALFGRTAVLVLAAVAALAVAFAVVSAVWLAHAKPSGDVQFANARDSVLVDAQKDIETINTLDYRKTDSGLDAWLDVSTGTQRDQVAQARTSIAAQVAQQKAITSGQVLAAAVMALDDRSGTATVIATVEQNVSLGGKAPVKKRDRYAADLSRTGGSWKISSITLVPV